MELAKRGGELVAASPFFILSPNGMVEVVVTAGTIRRANIQSDRHHRQTTPASYRPDAFTVARPTVSEQ